MDGSPFETSSLTSEPFVEIATFAFYAGFTHEFSRFGTKVPIAV